MTTTTAGTSIPSKKADKAKPDRKRLTKRELKRYELDVDAVRFTYVRQALDLAKHHGSFDEAMAYAEARLAGEHAAQAFGATKWARIVIEFRRIAGTY